VEPWVKSTGLFALHVRQVFCGEFRLVYDPLPILAGLLPRRNLHRLVGVFLDVADRELLALDLFRFLLSQNRSVILSPDLTSPVVGCKPATTPARETSEWNGACDRVSKPCRAWDSKATPALGSSCCGFTSEGHTLRRKGQDLPAAFQGSGPSLRATSFHRNLTPSSRSRVSRVLVASPPDCSITA
jgi:hypothetical protein